MFLLTKNRLNPKISPTHSVVIFSSSTVYTIKEVSQDLLQPTQLPQIWTGEPILERTGVPQNYAIYLGSNRDGGIRDHPWCGKPR